MTTSRLRGFTGYALSSLGTIIGADFVLSALRFFKPWPPAVVAIPVVIGSFVGAWILLRDRQP